MKELFPEKFCLSDEARQPGGKENRRGRNMIWYEQDSFGSREGQRRDLVNAVKNLRVQHNVLKLLSS
jgi:hypothetical protein